MMSWRENLHKLLSAGQKVAILGVGSELCGDDAAGMMLVARLKQLLPHGQESVLLLAGSTAPENFTGPIRRFAPDLLLLVDAAGFGAATGSISFIAAEDMANAGFSTHMLPLSVLLSYIEQETGCEIAIIGIEPEQTAFATFACQAVAQSVEHLAEAICADLINRQ